MNVREVSEPTDLLPQEIYGRGGRGDKEFVAVTADFLLSMAN